MTAPLVPELFHGALEVERAGRGLRPHRLPSAVRTRDADAQLLSAQAQPSGVRVVVATTARRLDLRLHATRQALGGVQRLRGAVDVVLDGELHRTHVLTGGTLVDVDLRTGAATTVEGPDEHVLVEDLPAGEKVVEFWLPHLEQVDVVGLDADAPVRPVTPSGPLWVHHGSSLSHGSNAASPTRTWPAIAARAAGVRLQNLGFGGSALVDPFLARVVRDRPADVVSVKFGINVVGGDAMRRRTFVAAVHGFLDTVRDGHPTVPLLVVSPLHCALHEDTPGPGSVDLAALARGELRFTATGAPGDTAGGRLTLRVVRDALREVVAARGDDPHLHHLDGLELFGAADEYEHPLPDALHLDTAGHAVVGRRFTERVFGAGGAFDRG
ncbi:GDSL-type esterase/lipase family protein [Kineococcus sp. NPDC059986]|uniref:GDSL-type esterase/lipase family protein n=1 Tax=Kineococcus sp. NPDC059986 TaxID=3155538 RepID=UPI00344B4C80